MTIRTISSTNIKFKVFLIVILGTTKNIFGCNDLRKIIKIKEQGRARQEEKEKGQKTSKIIPSTTPMYCFSVAEIKTETKGIIN